MLKNAKTYNNMLKHKKCMLKNAKTYNNMLKHIKNIWKNAKSDSEAVCRST